MIKNLVAAMLAVGAISNVLKQGTATFDPGVTFTSFADEKLETSV